MSDIHEPKSQRPADTAFKQQRLPAWQPILTARNVMPIFFAIAAAFIPIGLGLLYLTNLVQEFSIDYTQCKSSNNQPCAEVIGGNRNLTCHCSIPFVLTEDFSPSVFMYYRLTNYYQNHRRYVKSRDDFQLTGKLSYTPSTDCTPYDYNDNKPIAPCGAIANSLFNDSLTLKYNDKNVPLLKTGIAWPSDKKIKFQNPPGYSLKEAFIGFAKPIDWQKNVWELDLENPANNGFENEDLIVWMRTAALPDFRKLYRRVDHTVNGFKIGLPKGNYTLNVDYNYPVAGFGGTKSLILSNTSFTGGSNWFLGYAYIVVGCICFLLGLLFLIIHIRYKPSISSQTNQIPTQMQMSSLLQISLLAFLILFTNTEVAVVTPSTSYQ